MLARHTVGGRFLKERLGTLFAATKGLVQCVYWICAFIIATRYIGGDFGELFWAYSGPGSLFPWPLPPGMLPALSPVNIVDQFIYYLIVSWMFIPVAIGLTALVGYIGRKIGEYLQRSEGKA